MFLMSVGSSVKMNNLKLATLFTVLITWSVVLLFTLSNEEKVYNKSIISIDTHINRVYIEYTDDIQLIKSYELAKNDRWLKVKRKQVIEYKRIAALKLAEEKRVAEEKRQVELARVKEEKRVAELVAKREAKNKLKQQNNKTQIASRGKSSNIKTSVYTVTAYTAGVESTGKRKGDKGYGKTASGAYVQEGVTIACPKNFKFGTKIEIEGVGVRVCQDTGSAIGSGKLDLYMENLGNAQQFGRKNLQVKIYHK